MTHEQITLVQQSFARIKSDADMIATRFYSKLFLLDPSLYHLFPVDITEQGQKLVAILAFVIQGLNNPGIFLPHVEKLGEQHQMYGVKDEDYDTVGAALLWTIEKELADGFTVEVHKAWVAAFTLLAQTMMRSGRASAIMVAAA